MSPTLITTAQPAVTVTVGAAPAPDLVVDTPTVDVSAPVAGARFTLSATVRNQGSGPSSPTTLHYYRSTDPTNTTNATEVGTDSVTGLGAQDSGAESISLVAPPTPGTYYYGACVDWMSDESDTYNNCSGRGARNRRRGTRRTRPSGGHASRWTSALLLQESASR